MTQPDETTETYDVREVVSRFTNADQFENAVDALQEQGVDRADISMIASHDAVKKKLGHLYNSSGDLEDERSVPQNLFASRHDVTEGRAAVIGLPTYIGGIAAGLAVVASGGTLGFAALIAAAGAATGAGVGGLFAHAIGDHHAKYMEEQLAAGGLLLWARVQNDNQEKEILQLLEKMGGEDVHAHSITRYWGNDDVPLHDFNPDPFLERFR
ncbi:hypothetical protein C8024_05845 [Sphingopyxis sp. BSNA05]|uniref:hypothetical protein n=1 Tax=Sphingopyxis sp. BSNA05 TaxID=1236614 RepID=UPI00156618F3|nr:hypothetical protein [Sphingopyxis sp. BSNA05]NRD89071.1 hypothetical protein [Sphingopyxis sp. BSNA05]